MTRVRQKHLELEAGIETVLEIVALHRSRGGTRIVEVRHAGSFEGAVTWIIGLDRKRPFSVDVLAAPSRLVVDVG